MASRSAGVFFRRISATCVSMTSMVRMRGPTVGLPVSLTMRILRGARSRREVGGRPSEVHPVTPQSPRRAPAQEMAISFGAILNQPVARRYPDRRATLTGSVGPPSRTGPVAGRRGRRSPPPRRLASRRGEPRPRSILSPSRLVVEPRSREPSKCPSLPARPEAGPVSEVETFIRLATDPPLSATATSSQPTTRRSRAGALREEWLVRQALEEPRPLPCPVNLRTHDPSCTQRPRAALGKNAESPLRSSILRSCRPQRHPSPRAASRTTD
jgi:hypothetical protein